MPPKGMPPALARPPKPDARRLRLRQPTKHARRWAKPRKIGGWLKHLAVPLVAFVGLVATTIGSVFAGLYAFAPDLAPRAKLGATIDRIAVEHGVTYADYDRRTGIEGSPVSTSSLGDLVFIRVTLTGYKDRGYAMLTSVLDDRGQAFRPDDDPSGMAIASCEIRSPKANEDGVAWRCWVRTPPPGTGYRIRAELYDAGPTQSPIVDVSHGPLLDFKESDHLTTP